MYKNVLLHLHLINGVGPAAIGAIVTRLGLASLPDIYQYSVGKIVQEFGFSEQIATRIAQGLADCSILERELMLIEKYGITILDYTQDEYPPLLKQIHGAPIILYVLGNHAALHERSISCVGARAATAYGRRMVDHIVPSLVDHGLSIVSGGAEGIDTFAHQAAVQAGGMTVVVLGSGLLRPYPLRNKKLFDQIVAARGAIVSSFPLQTAPLPAHFPARNRIIAGLSRGTLVVQAAAKSGSLITADFALNQGKDVFAIPGQIDDLLSAGCHDLIRQGATLVRSAHDIIEQYGLIHTTAATVQADAFKGMPRSEKSQQAKIPVAATPQSGVQQIIITHCRQPALFDELLAITGLSMVALQNELFTLQLEGQLTQNGAGLWERC